MLTSDDHNIALGKMTTEYSRLDFETSIFLWRLLHPAAKVGATISAGLMLGPKIDLLRRLFAALPGLGAEADIGALDQALGLAEKASGKRNDLVHTLAWASLADDTTAVTFRVKKRGEERFEEVIVTAAEIDDVVEGLATAADAVVNVFEQHFKPYIEGPAFGTFWETSLIEKYNRQTEI
jgi:hypothetical protein